VLLSAADTSKKKLEEVQASLSKLEEEAKKKDQDNDDKDIAASRKKADPVTVRLLRDNRTQKLDALVSAAKVTPAVKEKLEKQFLSDGALNFAVTSGKMEDFDALVDALAENDPVKLQEQSGPQVLASLSRGTSEDDDVLVKDAENRAKEAAAK